jgi:hypothetical protein
MLGQEHAMNRSSAGPRVVSNTQEFVKLENVSGNLVRMDGAMKPGPKR